MRVVVLGAGVVGVATAWYLARGGAEVVVVDRAVEVGSGTSFANGALLTPSTSDSWAAPGTARKILGWLGREDAPMLLRWRALPGLAAWGVRFLANCREERWRANSRAILALARFSLAETQALVAAEGLAFDRNPPGLLKLFRDELSMEAALRAAELLGELGLPLERLEPRAAVELEPALAPVQERIRGAVHYPADASGDARQFAQVLAERCAGKGVRFRLGTRVERLEGSGGRVAAAVAAGGERLAADAFVVAAGPWSPALARPLGLRLPIRPAKGYSVTLGTAGWNRGPRRPILDDGRKLAVVPLGDRLRVAGTVEFAGMDRTVNPRRAANLVAALAEVLPDYPRGAPVESWAGLRPLTPDGRPILGATRLANLFLNTGHGPLGWTLACGSGAVLAELVLGRRPPLDLAPYAWPRAG